MAVVAETGGQPSGALKAADPQFSGDSNPRGHARTFSSNALDRAMRRAGSAAAIMIRTVRGSRPLAATYYAAPSQHLGLEPFARRRVRTAHGVELWTARRRRASSARRQSILYPLPSGEPAGRAMEADAVPIAIELARRTEAAGAGYRSRSPQARTTTGFAPGALARMTALPGDGGITAAWGMKVVTADGFGSALARLQGADPPRNSARPRSTAPFRPIPFRM